MSDTQAASPAPSLRDQLNAAFDAAAETEPVSAPEPVIEDAPEPVESLEGTDEPEDRPGQPRDDAGRFAAKAAEKAAKDKAKADQNAQAPEAPAEAPPEPATAGLKAPDHWTAADKAIFAQDNPTALKKLALAQARRFEQQISQQARDIKPLREVAAKWQPYLDQLGQHFGTRVTTEMALDELLAADHRLRTGSTAVKQEALAKLLKNYGISWPGQAAQSTAQPPAAQQPAASAYVDPAVQQLSQKLAVIERGLTSRQAAEEAARQRAAQAQLQTQSQAIEQFKDQLSESGDPAHPYFEEVFPKMLTLAVGYRQQREPVPSLEQLYDEAVHATPAVRERVYSAQRAAEQQKLAAARAAKVASATAASRSITGTPGGLAPQAPGHKTSVRESIRQAEAQVARHGRV